MGLDAVELVIRFENVFGIRIPDEVAEQLTTPRKVTDYVLTQVAVSEQHSFKVENKVWSREQVASVVREIIIDEVGIKDFTEDSHFIDDMHLD